MYRFVARFRCQVFVCDQLVVEAYGLNKKEAKKRAAEEAIEVIVPQDKVGGLWKTSVNSQCLMITFLQSTSCSDFKV